MSDYIPFERDEQQIAKEKQKAKELRKTQWWKRQLAGGICHYCHEHFPPEALTMDHIVPLARGGRSNKGNVVPCCKSCNSRKKYLTPADMVLEKLKTENPDPLLPHTEEDGSNS